MSKPSKKAAHPWGKKPLKGHLGPTAPKKGKSPGSDGPYLGPSFGLEAFLSSVEDAKKKALTISLGNEPDEWLGESTANPEGVDYEEGAPEPKLDPEICAAINAALGIDEGGVEDKEGDMYPKESNPSTWTPYTFFSPQEVPPEVVKSWPVKKVVVGTKDSLHDMSVDLTVTVDFSVPHPLIASSQSGGAVSFSEKVVAMAALHAVLGLKGDVVPDAYKLAQAVEEILAIFPEGSILPPGTLIRKTLKKYGVLL